MAQVVVLLAEVVGDHAVDHERAVHLAGRGEYLAAREIAPLLGVIRLLVFNHR